MAEDKTHKSLEQRSRLQRIREHLGIRTSVDSPAFEEAVAAVCRERITSLMEGSNPQSGEEVLDHVARRLQVRFEEVHDEHDLAALETKYLKEKREIGFGQLSMQFEDPGVDALLFQRERAAADASDKWVAVLNLRETIRRAYWSRSHELIHRVAEPPQMQLFYRHRNDKINPLESLIDTVAADLAFYPDLFLPLVEAVSGEPLSWELVGRVRNQYAPSSSLLATAHAVLRAWPCPAYLLKAQMRGRKGRPHQDVALRIKVDGFSAAKGDRVFFFDNMRPPRSSPIWHAYNAGESITAYEQLGEWTTSRGGRMPNARALTSTFVWRNTVFALLTIV